MIQQAITEKSQFLNGTELATCFVQVRLFVFNYKFHHFERKLEIHHYFVHCR